MKETFNIVFSYNRKLYVGHVEVYEAPRSYYYCVFINNKQILLFVDDERDEWIESGKGNSTLAAIIGQAIDRHYHPDYFRNNERIDPE